MMSFLGRSIVAQKCVTTGEWQNAAGYCWLSIRALMSEYTLELTGDFYILYIYPPTPRPRKTGNVGEQDTRDDIKGCSEKS